MVMDIRTRGITALKCQTVLRWTQITMASGTSVMMMMITMGFQISFLPAQITADLFPTPVKKILM
ncbi:hypothetical protein M9458_037462, partial [Cirrhinus mrigala]